MAQDGSDHKPEKASPGVEPVPPKPSTSAAARALAEAEARYRERLAHAAELKKTREIDGRGGPDPVRYGDWENKGLASDF